MSQIFLDRIQQLKELLAGLLDRLEISTASFRVAQRMSMSQHSEDTLEMFAIASSSSAASSPSHLSSSDNSPLNGTMALPTPEIMLPEMPSAPNKLGLTLDCSNIQPSLSIHSPQSPAFVKSKGQLHEEAEVFRKNSVLHVEKDDESGIVQQTEALKLKILRTALKKVPTDLEKLLKQTEEQSVASPSSNVT